MNIIFLSILLTSQAQYIDEQSTINSFSLITQNIKEEGRTLFTESSNDISDETKSMYENETWSSIFSFSSKTDLDQTTLTNQIELSKEEWININQSNKNDSSVFWRKINDKSLDGLTYIIKSSGECVRNMCHVKLKYNSSLSNRNDGCLSFILWTRGQPVGQLWIEEDEEQESFSQKIQLTNSSLRVEHSFKSNIQNLSINARILFRNIQMDSITLSNLNINLKGPCPKHHSEVTILPNYQSTFEDDLMTLTSEDYSQTRDDRFEITEDDYLVESSTIKLDKNLIIKRSSSYLNESNIKWILSLIVLFCLSIIITSFIYGFWTIQKHYRFIWYVPFDYPIQFLARRSIRSSTRSENKISTLSQICNDLLLINYQQEDFDTFTTNSNRSTPSAFYTYF